MPRRIRARTTRSLRDQFMRELEREGERILKQLTEQFLRDLQTQTSQAIAQGSSGKASGLGVGGLDFSNFTRLFGNLLAIVISRPRTSVSTRETPRSKEAAETFRLSRGQALAETGLELNKGEKNL